MSTFVTYVMAVSFSKSEEFYTANGEDWVHYIEQMPMGCLSVQYKLSNLKMAHWKQKLFDHRITSYSTTGISPTTLLMNRQPRS